jgi:tetratricopeptide (TPR) repeat protein
MRSGGKGHASEAGRPVSGSRPAKFFAGALLGVFLAGARPADGADLSIAVRALDRGDYLQAAVMARQYLKTQPASPDARVVLAQAELLQGRPEAAYEELRKALEADPSHIDALYFQAQVCLILSQFERQKLFALAPESARVHQLMAEAARAEQDLTGAEEEYRAALEANPRLVEVLVELADLLRSQFRFEEAIEFYSRATAISPRDYAGWYGLGAAFLYREEPERAAEYFRKALETDPDSPAARLALGDALLRMGRPADAIQELRRAAELQPEMRQAFSLLARAYNRLGQREQALEALRQAEEISRREKERREALLEADDFVIVARPAPRQPSGEGGEQ